MNHPKAGPITKALEDAVEMRRQILDVGHSNQEVDQLVGQGLKALLGNKRSEPWRFYCEHCRDTGWINVQPSERELVRLTALYGDNPQYQGYVVKCDPCKWTQMEREKRRKRSSEFDDDDLGEAGQVKPKRGGFTRFGK